MNTINGDPTTERLLPLIDAASRAELNASASTPDGTTTPTSVTGGRPSVNGSRRTGAFPAAGSLGLLLQFATRE